MRILRDQLKRGSRIFCQECGRSHAWKNFTEDGDINDSHIRSSYRGHDWHAFVFDDIDEWRIAFSQQYIAKRRGSVYYTAYIAYCPTCLSQMQLPEDEDISAEDYLLRLYHNEYRDDASLVRTGVQIHEGLTDMIEEITAQHSQHESLTDMIEEEEQVETVDSTDYDTVLMSNVNTYLNKYVRVIDSSKVYNTWGDFCEINSLEPPSFNDKPIKGMIGKVTFVGRHMYQDNILCFVEFGPNYRMLIRTTGLEVVTEDIQEPPLFIGATVNCRRYRLTASERETLESYGFSADELADDETTPIANIMTNVKIVAAVPLGTTDIAIVSIGYGRFVAVNSSDITIPLGSRYSAQMLRQIDIFRMGRFALRNRLVRLTEAPERESTTRIIDIWFHHKTKSL